VKKIVRFVALLGSLAMVVVATTACGGDGETEPSPTATATAAPAAETTAAPTTGATVEASGELESLLKAAALRLEDLPSGFILDEEKFITNEESAGGSSGGATLEDLNRFGRLLGYEASYSRETAPDSSWVFLQVTMDVYRDSAGAGEHFELGRRQASDPEFIKAFQEGFAGASDVPDVSVSPMSFAEVGDDRIAFEVKITVHSAELNTDVLSVTQSVAIRRGRGIGSIAVSAVGSPPPVQELEDLARTLDQRLKDALE
jgi:hypothetical protein